MSYGKSVTRYVRAKGPSGEIEIVVRIKGGHVLTNFRAAEMGEYHASEAMKAIAAAPSLAFPLSKIKVSGH